MNASCDYTNRINNIRNENGRPVEVHPVTTRQATPEELERYFGAAEKKYRHNKDRKPVVVGHLNDEEQTAAEAQEAKEDMEAAEAMKVKLMVSAIARKCGEVDRDEWEKDRMAVELVGRVRGWR